MKRYRNESEYSLPGDEYTLPPEQPETLLDKSRYPGAFGAPSESRAEAEERVKPTLLADESALAASKEADASQTTARKTKRKRSLLLQMAAVASSLVLVTNSFGLDFLGLDGLFNDSVIIGRIEQETQPAAPADQLPGFPVGGDLNLPEDSRPESPREDAMITAGRFSPSLNSRDCQLTVEGYAYAGDWSIREYEIPDSLFLPESQGISYDQGRNTLTLSDYHGVGLEISKMGTDFTIRLEGDNTLEQSIVADSTILHFSGSGSLNINAEKNLEYGIKLEPYDNHDGYIVVGREVNMDVYGSECAISAENTGAERMLYYLSDKALEGVRQIPNAWTNEEGESSWWLIEPDASRMAKHICFGNGAGTQPRPVDEETEPVPPESSVPIETVAPTEPPTEPVPQEIGLAVGGDSAFPILGNPLPTDPSMTIYFDKTGNGWGSHLSVPGDADYNDPEGYGVYYNKTSNTLTLRNFQGGSLHISGMGNSFKLSLEGKNELTNRLLVEGHSLTITGSGYLAVNSSKQDTYGIQLDLSYAETCLMIDSGVTLDIYGSGWSAGVRDTSAEKAIWVLSPYPLFGVRQVISDDPGVSGQDYAAWNTVDTDGLAVRSLHIGGEVPPDPEYPGLPVGGDAAFPELPNPEPNTPLPGYGILNEDYVQLFDRDTNTWEYLYLNAAWGDERVTAEGIRYDRSTNTLTLNNYHGAGISTNLLGNGLTVELIGENELTQDFMVWGFYSGGSIRFTGTGSLTINSSRTQDVGLQLICEFSTSCLMIDPGVTLDIYGNGFAVEVIYTNAEKGFWLISERPLRNVRQQISGEDTSDLDGERYQVWILTDNNSVPLTHLHIGGN